MGTGDWDAAAKAREGLLEYLQGITGVGTLLDYRRREDYDSHHFVDKFLNLPEVKVKTKLSSSLVAKHYRSLRL